MIGGVLDKEFWADSIRRGENLFTPKSGKNRWLSLLARVVVVVLIGMAFAPLYLDALPAEATHDGRGHNPGPEVTPELRPEDNPKCPDLQKPGQNWRGLSTETAPPDGTTSTYSNDDLTVTITTDSTGKFATWTASIPIDGVLMKSGDNFFYRYDDPTITTDPGELTYDDGLKTPGADNQNAISHIVFCYDIDPDLTIAKSASKSSVQPGESFSFFLTVSNVGQSTATTVTISDDLDDRLTGVVATFDNNPGSAGGNGSCTVGGGNTVSCPVGNLGPSDGNTTGSEPDTALVEITANAPAAACDQIVNTATTNAGNLEPNTSNNTSNQVTVDIVCSDVTILKTAAQSPINAGDEASFTILVTSTGETTATNVSVSDTLPSGIVWTDDSASCSISGTLLTCNFGDLGPGETRSVTVTGTTDAGDCGTKNNIAHVAATNEPSGNQDNNSSSASIVIQCGNVEIEKTADDSVINAGDEIGFTLLVSNSGIGTAKGVRVTDTLPAGFSWQEDPDNAQCSISGDLLTCNFGDLAAGATRTVHVVSTTDPEDCGVVTNTAEVGTSNDGSDSSSASVTINCSDVSVTKDGNGTISSGDDAVFTLVVSNNGSGDAPDVTLFDNLPDGVSWTISDDPSSSCQINFLGDLTCDFGTLSAGETRTVSVSAETNAQDCGPLVNQAEVTATNDSNPDNNTDSATINVICAEIAILKTADDDSVVAGDPIGFTILVTNNGDGRADGVTVTDTLPSNGGLNWTIDGGTGASDCSISSGTLTCNFGSMGSGATRTVHISSTTTAETCGTVNNTAFVTTSNDGSDSDSESMTVTCPSLGIVIDKTVNPSQGVPGTPVVYTFVVTNTGEATLFNIKVDDDKLGHIGDIAQLAPGESASLHKNSVLGNAAVTNVATAVGTDRLGRTVSDTDDASVSVVLPLTLERPPAPAPAVAPQAIAKTGAEVWPLLFSALLMFLIGSVSLRSSRTQHREAQGHRF